MKDGPSYVSNALRALAGRRLVLAAKEAGAGSLLAAMLDTLRPAGESVVVVSSAAARFFEGARAKLLNAEAGWFPDQAAEDLLRQAAPQAILVGASAGPSVEKILIRAAVRNGIPAYSFVDHYWNLWQRFADERSAARWAYLPDRIFVPAEHCRNRIVAQGCDPQRVEVFEHPLLAAARARGEDAAAAELRRKARAELGIPAAATVLLFVSEYVFPRDPLWQWEQPEQADIDGLLQLLLRSAQQAGAGSGRDWVVLVKLHPAQESPPLGVLRSFPSALYRIAKDVDKGAIISAADAAFGLNSMLLLEAALGGLPAYSHHAVSAGSDAWLSRIRPEVVELSDPADFARAVAGAARP